MLDFVRDNATCHVLGGGSDSGIERGGVVQHCDRSDVLREHSERQMEFRHRHEQPARVDRGCLLLSFMFSRYMTKDHGSLFSPACLAVRRRRPTSTQPLVACGCFRTKGRLQGSIRLGADSTRFRRKISVREARQPGWSLERLKCLISPVQAREAPG